MGRGRLGEVEIRMDEPAPSWRSRVRARVIGLRAYPPLGGRQQPQAKNRAIAFIDSIGAGRFQLEKRRSARNATMIEQALTLRGAPRDARPTQTAGMSVATTSPV